MQVPGVGMGMAWEACAPSLQGGVRGAGDEVEAALGEVVSQATAISVWVPCWRLGTPSGSSGSISLTG